MSNTAGDPQPFCNNDPCAYCVYKTSIVAQPIVFAEKTNEVKILEVLQKILDKLEQIRMEI